MSGDNETEAEAECPPYLGSYLKDSFGVGIAVISRSCGLEMRLNITCVLGLVIHQESRQAFSSRLCHEMSLVLSLR